MMQRAHRSCADVVDAVENFGQSAERLHRLRGNRGADHLQNQRLGARTAQQEINQQALVRKMNST